MSIEDNYAFVHNPKSDIQGIGIKSGKYHGIIYEYQNVSFGTLEDNPDEEVLLSFKYDIFKSVSTRIELPDGSKTFGKTINNDPEKYYTEEVMEKLDEAAKKEFLYG